jgi:AraC-like DNA-binding protein
MWVSGTNTPVPKGSKHNMNSAEERAIKFIAERYSEQLSLADIANSAILSRFHFCRSFRDATGVTPGRFLSAIRIYHAKRMLVNTGMNVTDIAYAVGFNSLGSFSNHFADSVGIAPGRFRRLFRGGGFTLPRTRRESSPPHGQVTGMIALPQGYAGGRVYLGAFDTPIVQRQPAADVIVDVPTAAVPVPYRLVGVPPGSWYLRAVAVADSAEPEPWTRRTLLIGGCGPTMVGAEAVVCADFELRSRRPTDLPILWAVPDLEPALAAVLTAEADIVPLAAARPAYRGHAWSAGGVSEAPGQS